MVVMTVRGWSWFDRDGMKIARVLSCVFYFPSNKCVLIILTIVKCLSGGMLDMTINIKAPRQSAGCRT